MDRTDSRSAHPPEPASDDVASPIDLQPVEALDRLAFEPVPLRYRSDGLTPARQRAYVEALADCGIAREAAARIGVSEQAVNRARRRSDAVSFDRACEAAQMFGARRLRSIAFERAVEGTPRGHYYRGELVGEERVYDNRLLTYLLGKVEHLLEPGAEARAICANWEDRMDALEQGPPPPALEPAAAAAVEDARDEFAGDELVEDDDGIWWTAFPPPEDFDGEERGDYGDLDYQRTLSPREQAAVDSDLEEEAGEDRAAEIARRDRFFGFAGGEFSSSTEAEPSETSEPSGADAEEEEWDWGEGPLEYKSLVPPSPSPAFRGRGNAAPGCVPRTQPWWGRIPRSGRVRVCTPDSEKTLTSHREAVGPSSPVKDGRGVCSRPTLSPPRVSLYPVCGSALGEAWRKKMLGGG